MIPRYTKNEVVSPVATFSSFDGPDGDVPLGGVVGGLPGVVAEGVHPEGVGVVFVPDGSGVIVPLGVTLSDGVGVTVPLGVTLPDGVGVTVPDGAGVTVPEGVVVGPFDGTFS